MNKHNNLLLQLSMIFTFLIILTSSPQLTSANIKTTDNSFTINLKQAQQQGYFDYNLALYENGSLLSNIHLPQNQNLSFITIEKRFSPKILVGLEYGSSQSGFKGTGSDSDFGNPLWGNANITDYATVDFRGKQQSFSIYTQYRLLNKPEQQTDLLLGWSKRSASNQIFNVNYWLLDNKVVPGGYLVPDNNSFLDNNIFGPYFGIKHRNQLDKHWAIYGQYTFQYLKASANGQWNTYQPPRFFTTAGYGWGRELKLGLEYNLPKNLSLELGYSYSLTTANRCDEILDLGDSNAGTILNLNNQVGMKSFQQGYFFTLKKLL